MKPQNGKTRTHGPFDVIERKTSVIIWSIDDASTLALFPCGHDGRNRAKAVENAKFVCKLLNHSGPRALNDGRAYRAQSRACSRSAIKAEGE